MVVLLLNGERWTDADYLDVNMDFMRATASLLVMSILSVGCATSYQPQETGRISYVLDGPGFSLYKNGEEFSANGLSSAPIRAVAGNPQAEEHARIFVRRSRIALALYAVAIASLVTSLSLSPDGHAQGDKREARLILGFSGVATLLFGSTVFMTAPGHLYDAVNIYNDGQPVRR